MNPAWSIGRGAHEDSGATDREMVALRHHERAASASAARERAIEPVTARNRSSPARVSSSVHSVVPGEQRHTR